MYNNDKEEALKYLYNEYIEKKKKEIKPMYPLIKLIQNKESLSFLKKIFSTDEKNPTNSDAEILKILEKKEKDITEEDAKKVSEEIKNKIILKKKNIKDDKLNDKSNLENRAVITAASYFALLFCAILPLGFIFTVFAIAISIGLTVGTKKMSDDIALRQNTEQNEIEKLENIEKTLSLVVNDYIYSGYDTYIKGDYPNTNQNKDFEEYYKKELNGFAKKDSEGASIQNQMLSPSINDLNKNQQDFNYNPLNNKI